MSLYLTVLYAIICIVYSSQYTLAENIDPDNLDSQYIYGENIGWLNAEPLGNGQVAINVSDNKLNGYIWAENIGWISLSCENTSSCSIINYGVINDGFGNLNGYAWSENAGWINFAPNYGGVTINIFTGKFSGWAWGENIGWINFDLTTQVQNAARTSWSVWEDDGDPANNWDTDTDGDGNKNLDDPDVDNDGLDNEAEYVLFGLNWNTDTDGDGLYNLIDEDSDGDGLLDGSDRDPLNYNRQTAMPWIPLLLMHE